MPKWVNKWWLHEGPRRQSAKDENIITALWASLSWAILGGFLRPLKLSISSQEVGNSLGFLASTESNPFI